LAWEWNSKFFTRLSAEDVFGGPPNTARDARVPHFFFDANFILSVFASKARRDKSKLAFISHSLNELHSYTTISSKDILWNFKQAAIHVKMVPGHCLAWRSCFGGGGSGRGLRIILPDRALVERRRACTAERAG
jgi:hypothetical protein